MHILNIILEKKSKIRVEKRINIISNKRLYSLERIGGRILEKIDIVITWVDGNDSKWMDEKKIWEKKEKKIETTNRFRDWGFFPFVFRSIEKYAPWVNHIFVVTCGQVPDFLDISNPKITLISHEEFIPTEFLPTFNSNTIEMWLGYIPGLSDHFIYMNDDMFFLSDTEPTDFFVRGLPVDEAIETALMYDDYFDTFGKIKLNSIIAINKNFNKRNVIKNNWRKWFKLSYGKGLLNNLFMFPFHKFSDFRLWHNPQSYLKETWKDVHSHLKAEINVTSSTKFRTETDMTQYVFRYWQLVTGNFYAKSRKNFLELCLTESQLGIILNSFSNSKCKMICLNDTDENCNFSFLQGKIKKSFEEKFPEKSSFEL